MNFVSINESAYSTRIIGMNKEMTFSQYAVGVFMAASISLGGYVAHSIATLNERMATIVEKISYSENRLSRHDSLIDDLKLRCWPHK